MRKPKLIYYNDARHYLLYRFDPPLSRQRLQSPVDDILGTGVDTLAFGLASGSTFLHNSNVANKWGDSELNIQVSMISAMDGFSVGNGLIDVIVTITMNSTLTVLN